jgi:hypothetical protein
MVGQFMISTERMEAALRYLAETDEQFAELKTAVERNKMKAKAVYSAIYLRSDGTVDERKSKAEKGEDHQAAMQAYFTALKEMEHIRNKRGTESILIDVWRSLNSSRNKGQVV